MTAKIPFTNVSIPNAVSAAVATACCHVRAYRLKNTPNAVIRATRDIASESGTRSLDSFGFAGTNCRR